MRVLPFLWIVFIGVPVLIWLGFRGKGYKRHPLDAPPGPDWQPTGERFIDPRGRDGGGVVSPTEWGAGLCAGRPRLKPLPGR